MSDKLRELEERNECVKVGVIGAGVFGSTVVVQLAKMKGVKPCIIADVRLENAIRAYELAGYKKSDIIKVNDSLKANIAIEKDKPVITKDSNVLLNSDVDIVVEATGIPEFGSKHAFEAIMNKKHVVMVNVEADVLVGPLLKRLADNSNVIYSLAYGDQPALIKELVDWASSLSLNIVAAGKGTRYVPKFRRSRPEDALKIFGFTNETIKVLKPNPKMYNSFIDGTKSAVEMVSVSNMTGLIPDVRGMHFPTASIQEIPIKLSLKKDGGILENEGVVEVISSLREDGSEVYPNLTWGVYIVFRSESSYVRKLLPQYGLYMNKNHKNALLYRPYHLVGVEAPISIAKIALYKEPTGSPISWYSDVITAAKKDLEKGEVLDGEGGYTVYGLAETARIAKRENLLPIGLANGVKVKRSIKMDEMITYDDVELNEESFGLRLRRMQESVFSI